MLIFTHKKIRLFQHFFFQKSQKIYILIQKQANFLLPESESAWRLIWIEDVPIHKYIEKNKKYFHLFSIKNVSTVLFVIRYRYRS